MNTQPERRDLYEQVNESIIEALLQSIDDGTGEWKRPWTLMGSQPMMNGISQTPYHGINALVLALSAAKHGYTENRWLTFNQCSERNWKIRRGSTGHRVVYAKKIDVADPDHPDKESKQVFMLKSYIVFNVDQLENGPPAQQPVKKESWELAAAVDKVVADSKVQIRHGGDHCAYLPNEDVIVMPHKGAFPDMESYASCLLHEIAHSTMHPDKLNRTEAYKGKFGSEDYAREELVAELSQLFISQAIGLDTASADAHSRFANHASYVGSWLKLLHANKREIFRAAAQAQKVADFVVSGRKPEMQVKESMAMSPENQAWANQYEAEEQKGFAATPSAHRPKQTSKGSGFVLPRTGVSAENTAMKSNSGFSGPN